jgi:hypothetical protein
LRPDLPAGVEAVILRQLAKKPRERYRTARSFAAALAEAVHAAIPSAVSPTPYRAGVLVSSDSVHAFRSTEAPPARHPAVATSARPRRRWLGAAAGLVLLAGALRFAGLPDVAPFNLIADTSGTVEPRAARSTLAPTPPATAASTAVALLPLPTSTSTPPAAPTTAPPPQSAQTAPDPGLSLERQADETIAQAIALIQDHNFPDPDLTLERLDRLYREMDPASDKRPAVEEIMVRAYLEDSDRRVKAAFVLKNANEGSESQKILHGAQQRFDRVAQIRPNDAILQDRVKRGREQAELTGLWVDFDAAYYAKQNDAQIAALTQIVAKSPDYRTPEGPAREKLYAAWIAKAEEAWGAQQADLARAALDEATGVDPDHPRARELRLTWFPPSAAPARAAAPVRRAGGWTPPAQVEASAAGGPVSVPESQPGPPVQQPQRLVPQNPYVNNEINAPNVGNQSHNSN